MVVSRVAPAPETPPLIRFPSVTSARLMRPAMGASISVNSQLSVAKSRVALADFSAMYLFAWSDVLWPGDLPLPEDSPAHSKAPHPSEHQTEKKEQCTRKMEQLQDFCSTLPQVRRALANIATYMICDDHDITDDWYLDGVWCQRVLGNELGRRIVRNGLLAYALFQAWGNTPDQFEEPHGTALLEAMDTWRGDELDRQPALIAQSIGLPDAFNGSGELQRSEQALHWHYTFSAPRYHLIVLDTPLNLLAFEFSNVVFSFVVGMLLLFLGLYGRASSQLPADNPYRQARGGGNPMSRVWQGDNLVQRQPPEPAGEIGELAEAEHAMAEGVATPGRVANRVRAFKADSANFSLPN